MSANTVRFKALGFPVTIEPTFLLLIGIYFLMGLESRTPLWSIASWSAVVFVSILIHELGHAAASRSMKVPVHKVVLWGLGGYVTHGHTLARNSLKISMAGPGIQLVIGVPVMLISWYAGVEDYVLRTVMAQWVFVNVGWALVNLLPMRPLDGGNALAYFLQGYRGYGPTRADRVAAQAGLGTGALVALGCFVFGETWLALIGAFCAYTNYQTMQRLG